MNTVYVCSFESIDTDVLIYHDIQYHCLNVSRYGDISIYRIRTNIGEELNLVNWQIITQSPSLNLTNIFSIVYKL